MRPAHAGKAAVVAVLLAATVACQPAHTQTADTATVRVKILAHGYPTQIFANHDGYTSSLVSDLPYTYTTLAAVHVRNVPLRTERAGCEIQVNGLKVAADYPTSDGVTAVCEWYNPHHK